MAENPMGVKAYKNFYVNFTNPDAPKLEGSALTEVVKLTETQKAIASLSNEPPVFIAKLI